MIKKEEKKKRVNHICACGCGQRISNAKIKRNAKYKNRKHFAKGKTLHKKRVIKPEGKIVAKGRGITSLLNKCFKLGLDKRNSELWIKDKTDLNSYWEVYQNGSNAN